MNCPHCGKAIEPQQSRASRARWGKLTPEEISAEMSRVRKKGLSKKKRTARRSNAEVRDRHPEGGNEKQENRAGGGSLD